MAVSVPNLCKLTSTLVTLLLFSLPLMAVQNCPRCSQYTRVYDGVGWICVSEKCNRLRADSGRDCIDIYTGSDLSSSLLQEKKESEWAVKFCEGKAWQQAAEVHGFVESDLSANLEGIALIRRCLAILYQRYSAVLDGENQKRKKQDFSELFYQRLQLYIQQSGRSSQETFDCKDFCSWLTSEGYGVVEVAAFEECGDVKDEVLVQENTLTLLCPVGVEGRYPLTITKAKSNSARKVKLSGFNMKPVALKALYLVPLLEELGRVCGTERPVAIIHSQIANWERETTSLL